MAFGLATDDEDFDFSKYLDVTLHTFGYDEDENVYGKIIETHPCTEAELTGEDSKFYPIKKSQSAYFEQNKGNFFCFDHTDISL